MASVFLYVPNVIGYIRFLSIIVCWVYFNDYRIVVPVYFFQAALDGVDGTVARCLNQCSSFGAWLDVLVDNFGRTIIWTQICSVLRGVVHYLWDVITVNVFLKALPKPLFRQFQEWFHTLIGGYVICGLHGLPLFLYMYFNSGSISFLGNYHSILLIPVIFLVPARLLCGAVECWFICIHVKMMSQQTLEDTNKNNNDSDE